MNIKNYTIGVAANTNCVIVGCENPIENRDTWLCASHSAEKRKAEKQAKKVKVVYPMKKVSAKKEKEIPQYSKLKKAFLEEKMKCELNFPGCYILASQIHHISKSDENFLNTETWIRCCPSCHKILEDMPAEERRLKGLLTD